MLRTRNADLIGEAGTFQREQASELDAKFKKLETDVDALRDFYKGAAADFDINSFKMGIANFKKVIEKIDSYGKYQEGIFKHDSENHDRAKKEVEELLAEPVIKNQIISETPTITISGDSNIAIANGVIDEGGTLNE